MIYQADTPVSGCSPEQVARTETEMLTNVIKSGTGTRARLDRPAAGKTGTTDNNSDAWFVGYTPQYTAAVWMGDWERSEVYMNNVGGIRVTGGTYPAEIWAAFMKPAHETLPVVQFTAPDENQWPGAQKIDEFGRVLLARFRRPAHRGARRPTDDDDTGPVVARADPPVAPAASRTPAAGGAGRPAPGRGMT